MLFVHVGLPKTGTTSIQRWLAREADGDSLSLLGTPLRGGRLTPAMRPFLRRAADAGRKRDFVLSHETLIGSWTNGWQAQGGNLQELAECLLGTGTRVIVTLRDPVAWFISLYRHGCSKGFQGSFGEFVSRLGGISWSSPLRLTDEVVKIFGPEAEVVFTDDGFSAVKHFADVVGRSEGFVDVPRYRYSGPMTSGGHGPDPLCIAVDSPTGHPRVHYSVEADEPRRALVGNDSVFQEMLEQRGCLPDVATRWIELGATLRGFPSEPPSVQVHEDGRQLERLIAVPTELFPGPAIGDSPRPTAANSIGLPLAIARVERLTQRRVPSVYIWLTRLAQRRKHGSEGAAHSVKK